VLEEAERDAALEVQELEAVVVVLHFLDDLVPERGPGQGDLCS